MNVLAVISPGLKVLFERVGKPEIANRPNLFRSSGAGAVKGMVNDSPMKRLGTADEVAHMVVWLCSDASHFSTGAVFDMSGGRARY